jgi:hypothetical protein
LAKGFSSDVPAERDQGSRHVIRSDSRESIAAHRGDRAGRVDHANSWGRVQEQIASRVKRHSERRDVGQQRRNAVGIRSDAASEGRDDAGGEIDATDAAISRIGNIESSVVVTEVAGFLDVGA